MLSSRRETVTIVVPVYNEAEVLAELFTRLLSVLEELQAAGILATVLFVDDGSLDGSPKILRDFHRKDARFGCLHLSRNFGHQAAIHAGLDHVTTDAVVVLDADLQDPPELVPKMIEIWRNGEAEAVYGQRASREGSAVKRLCYTIFYRVFNAIVDTKIPPDSGDFALMDRCVYECLRSFPERVRFLRGLRSWVGFRQVALPYHRPERQAGRPKYSFKHLYSLATDGIASFSVAPLKVAQVLAFLWFLATMTFIVWLVATRPFSQIDPLFGLGILLGLSVAMLFLCIYILGAYISRMYLETKHRPAYVAAAYSPGIPTSSVPKPE